MRLITGIYDRLLVFMKHRTGRKLVITWHNCLNSLMRQLTCSQLRLAVMVAGLEFRSSDLCYSSHSISVAQSGLCLTSDAQILVLSKQQACQEQYGEGLPSSMSYCSVIAGKLLLFYVFTLFPDPKSDAAFHCCLLYQFQISLF